ncbi:MAG: hypothetical protein RL024_741 [Actinomycetota bacterium]
MYVTTGLIELTAVLRFIANSAIVVIAKKRDWFLVFTSVLAGTESAANHLMPSPKSSRYSVGRQGH